MHHISEDELKQIAKEYRAILGGDSGDWTYAMALVAIARFIGHGQYDRSGQSWVQRHIIGIEPDFTEGHLLRERVDESHFFRRIDLAELLFNLQEVEGLDRVLATLRSNEIESALAELETAKLLMLAGLEFRFVVPVGAKGSDFDVEIALPSGSINCEIKCKVEATDLSDSTILNTLRDASSQLPRIGPNVIFVKLPTPWAWQEQVRNTVNSAARRFYGHSRRVDAIVFHWAVFMPLGDRRMRRATGCWLVANDASEHRATVINELAARLAPLFTSDLKSNPYSRGGTRFWTHLPDIANEML